MRIMADLMDQNYPQVLKKKRVGGSEGQVQVIFAALPIPLRGIFHGTTQTQSAVQN